MKTPMDTQNKLFIGNLPYTVDEMQMRQMFETFGELLEVTVIKDRMTGRSKGFGFVTFKNKEDAEKAIKEMHEKEVDGRKMIVNVARPREERPRR